MKWTFATAGLIIIGLFGIVIIILFHEITVSNEQDYYTLKEATEAAMLEAVDSAYYRLTGRLKMNEEKFVENFTRRFVNSSTYGQGNYYIDFYQISEYPAKVSLKIVDNTNQYNIYTTFDESLEPTQAKIVNSLSAIIDGYDIDESYSYIEGVYVDELGGTGGSGEGGEGGGGQQPSLPNDTVSPYCPLYTRMSQDSTYILYSLLYDYPHKKCSFMAFIDLKLDNYSFESTPMGYTFVTDTLACPSGYPNYNKSGWCSK